jgi:DNA (cytosine-5)-methyltransferase 1
MGIQTLSGDSLGLNTIVGESKVDLIIGGPPCQAYPGRAELGINGMKDDYQIFFLFESYVKNGCSF